MSKIIATAAIRGAHKYVREAEEKLKEAIAQKGENCKVEYPNTAYYLPIILAFFGLKVQYLKDLWDPLDRAKKLLPPLPSESVWLPYLGPTLDAGIATLVAEEIIESLKYLIGPNPVSGIWLGFADDSILREQGIKLVDGRMPGFAACVGACPTNEEAVKLIRELQEKKILVFIASNTNGKSIAEQLDEEGIQLGWDTYIVPFGKDTSASIYALNFAARSAMTFGGLQPGNLQQAREILLYNKKRVNAFVLALGTVDDEKYATAAGAINFGFPVIADTDIPQILPTGVCTYEHVVSKIPLSDIVAKGIEVRGLKIKVEKLPIPVSYGPAFEGERVRKEHIGVEFGGKYSKAYEYLKMRDMDEVQDCKIEVIGPEIDEIADAGVLPFGIFVEVAGRKMQKEFESILERRFHTFLSEALGVMHIVQRDLIWVRISKDTRKAGFKFKHLGVILHAKLLSEFPAIIDKVQVTLYTKQEDVDKMMPEAQAAYKERDERIGGMKDEDIDIFYSCALCQSYAPDHLCIITPERLGLCGAYSWLDGKAAYEINPAGANQPVAKGETINSKTGEWKGVNELIAAKSHGKLEHFSAYSMIESPMTSCGCFECIVGVVPEANGVMVVQRGYGGMTPAGMTFSTLAGTVGGGLQTPGFIGVGRMYLTSKKFISADGGFLRIVWMPKELKEALAERFKKRAEELGASDFLEKIADETTATTPEELLAFLQKVNHPALTMPSML